MKEQELRFVGSVPGSYDRLMVPFFFRPYAEELARRAQQSRPKRIIETAAGTGVVTEALNRAIRDAEIIATDLNQPMLEVAADRLRSDKICFVTADAAELPFDSRGFDLVVCQFGAMFFPDKVRAHAEARRVLREDGRYLLAIWDRIERNPVSAATQQALIDFFPDDPPLFLCQGPFGYHDPAAIEADLRHAGFGSVHIDTVELRSRSPSAHDAAAALCYGTPMAIELEDRGHHTLDRVFAEVERALGRFVKAEGIDEPMSAHIVTASH